MLLILTGRENGEELKIQNQAEPEGTDPNQMKPEFFFAK